MTVIECPKKKDNTKQVAKKTNCWPLIQSFVTTGVRITLPPRRTAHPPFMGTFHQLLPSDGFPACRSSAAVCLTSPSTVNLLQFSDTVLVSLTAAAASSNLSCRATNPSRPSLYIYAVITWAEHKFSELSFSRLRIHVSGQPNLTAIPSPSSGESPRF